MGTAAQPTIAHGIARLHPDVELPYDYWRWGPEWVLPMGRSGRWALNTLYNFAVRVEFDESGPGAPDARPLAAFGRTLAVARELKRAQEALSAEEEERLADWLGYADKREGAAFVREFTIRRRREHGDLPTVAKGAYIRRHPLSEGVWHIATGRTFDDGGQRIHVYAECSNGSVVVDLGDPQHREVTVTDDPGANVCRRCLSRVVATMPSPVTAEPAGVPA